jgi:hypothetical protein
VKAGDLVRFIGSHRGSDPGLLVSIGRTGWCDILISQGVVNWPTVQLEVISEVGKLRPPIACSPSVSVVY